MFLIVPLSLILISLSLVLYISIRKFSYLKKLSAEHAGVEDDIRNYRSFIVAMFPEIIEYFSKINFASHKTTLLLESEKILRRLRVWSMKMDNFSNKMIHRIRVNEEDMAQDVKEEISSIAGEVKRSVDFGFKSYNIKIKYDDLKKEEQILIMEIAKDPKQPELYKTLGNLYLQLGQLNDARESFASAIKFNPEIKGVKKKLELLDKVLSSSLDGAKS